MITKLSDWYRIVTVDLKHEVLEKRQTAIESIINLIISKNDPGMVLQLLSGIGWHFRANSDIVNFLLSELQQTDLTFPTELENCETELQVVGSLALYEIISRSQKGSPLVVRLAPILVLTGLNLRTALKIENIHYGNMINSLVECSKDALLKISEKNRKRPSISVDQVKIREVLTAGTAQGQNDNQVLISSIEKILTSFQKQIMALDEASRIDHEEINILWWLFAKRSTITNQLFSDLSLPVAILIGGTELADISIIPPYPSSVDILLDAISTSRDEDKRITLDEIVSDWSKNLSELRVLNLGVTDKMSQYPVVFPIFWILRRLYESQGQTDWVNEFITKTGIKVDFPLDISVWAEQILWERVCWRVIDNVR